MKTIKFIKILSFLFILIGLLVSLQNTKAQETVTRDVTEMTREEVLNIPYEQLIEMPLDQLLQLADIVGVSLEELYEMILNKDIVSASKKVEQSFEAPLSTSVISYNEIVKSGVRTIEEALRLIPGVIVREKTNGNFDVHIRGNDNLPGNHMILYSENSITLVMIDGRPVYNYAHGGTFWETLPVGLQDIDRIEVVRGPSSALYGPNAVSGVVNIITKTVDNQKLQATGNVESGSHGILKTNLGIGKKVTDKFGIRVTGNFDQYKRNSELLYVHLANGGEGGFISKEELAELKNPNDTSYKVFDPADDVDDMYPNPDLSRQTMGGNAYVFYDVNDNISTGLKFGYQSSEVLSSTMGDNPAACVGRISNTGYFDFNGKIKNLQIKVNGLNGWQDIIRQDTGFKIDISNFNASAEYNLKLGKLEVTPGFFFQKADYNDRPYLSTEGQGFLNGNKDLTSQALSLRADYRPMEKIRLIAAVRGEKYNTHDGPYLSYQFAGLYNITENALLRGVYSKANRGPFLIDSYSNFLWDREGRPDPGYIYFQGTKNLDLLTMDMLEFGFRWKPLMNLQLDLELFQTTSQNFGALYPDSASLNLGDRTFVRMSYQNINLEAVQQGASLSLSWVANENLVVKAFSTIQRTDIYNEIVLKQDATIEDMLVKAYMSFTSDPANFTYDNFDPDEVDEKVHEWTPSAFGGLTVNYTFLNEKASIFSSTYYVTEQKFSDKYGDTRIDAQIIQNIKLSYAIVNNLNVYVNARNLIGNSVQFPYMDKTEPIFLGGITYQIN